MNGTYGTDQTYSGKLPIQQGFTEHFTDEANATEWAIAWLRDRQFTVRFVPDGRNWESPKELHARLTPGMVRTTFLQRLNHTGAPAFLAERGPSRRLLRLKSTPALEAWLTRPVTKGKLQEVLA